jgi:electron transfer flavoprotein alpha subunit
MSRILIFAEQRDGQIHPATSQLIAAAKTLDPSAERHLVVIGDDLDQTKATLAAHDVTRVLTMESPDLKRYHPRGYAQALTTAIEQVEPKLTLLPATFMGRDLAPRVAVRAKAALATDCTALRYEGEALIVERPAYMGKVIATVALATDRSSIVSIRPNTFAPDQPTGANAAIEPLDVTLELGSLQNTACESTSSGEKDLADADIVVSGGRSLKSEENFKILYELAHVLDAAVGASRAACDAGYQPHSQQVGLTGKTVTPRLYMAFGIDGAIQHLAGMRGSKCIVAINTKKEAPIFGVAQYGCVADLFVMAPLLTEEFKQVLAR